MLFCDLNNPAAVSNELPREHVSFGVIGLPADDFKVRHRLSFDVINGRQHGETLFVFSTFSLSFLVFVFAKQSWIQLGTVVRIKAVAAMKCLMDGFYRFFDAVFATTPFVAPCDCLGFLANQVAVAALTLAAVPVQAQTGDQAQLVLISGVNGSYHSMGGVYPDVINKVTFTMPTMQGCVEAGKLWAQVEGKETGFRKGWRKYQCFDRY